MYVRFGYKDPTLCTDVKSVGTCRARVRARRKETPFVRRRSLLPEILVTSVSLSFLHLSCIAFVCVREVHPAFVSSEATRRSSLARV